jgi:hypothetical protein
MKALVIFIFCVNTVVGFSQVIDSTAGNMDSLEISQPAVPGQQDPQAKDGNPLNDEANIRMVREEVPPFLQKILQDEKFRGWENGGIYRNEEGTNFKVEVMDGMNNRTYYFDKEGTLLRAE